MSDVLKNLGERIRTFRKAANLTRARLAEKAAISVYYVGEIERGEASPSLSTIQDIAKALGVKIRELFYFPSEQETPKEIVEEIVMRLQAEGFSDVEGLMLIREMVKRIAVERER